MNKIINLCAVIVVCSMQPLVGCQENSSYTSISITNQGPSVMKLFFNNSSGRTICDCYLAASQLVINKSDFQPSCRAQICLPITPLTLTIMQCSKSTVVNLATKELQGITNVLLYKDFARLIYSNRPFRDVHYS